MILETMMAVAFAAYHTKSQDSSDKPILKEADHRDSRSSTTNQPQTSEKLAVQTPSKTQPHKSIQKQKQESVTINAQVNIFVVAEK